MYSPDIPSDFLHDESRLTGSAEAVAFPRTTEEVRNAVRQAAGRPVTIQGARTGISGGAVPDGGLIISLARMTRILSPVTLTPDGQYAVTAQPGVLLSELRNFLKTQDKCSTRHVTSENTEHIGKDPDTHPPLIFAPDPTETSASIGGITACNASGACSFAYGAARRHVIGLSVVLADGDTVHLKRGVQHASDRMFTLKTDSGKTISGMLPSYTAPNVKTAAGYSVKPGMDIIDLFIGSEGTLGIITGIELLLLPAPEMITGIICFFDAEEKALNFVYEIRQHSSENYAQLNAIEYFDAGSLSLMQESTDKTGLLLPKFQDHWKNAVYIEWTHRKNCDRRHFALTSQILTKCGASAADTWLSADSTGIKRMKDLRHCVPEQINFIISERKKNCSELTKLGTDLSVPDSRLKDVLHLYRHDLTCANLEYVIFGHIGNNHLHVNIIPRNMKEYETGRKLYRRWAEQVARWGGSVSAEHGIGRLKKDMLAVMYGAEHIQEMKALKSLFDPELRLNPGRLF
ncbi:MAG: FAD-binding oxidoreductase [Kiritimatiellia bacterium]